MTNPIAAMSPNLRARIAGAFYVICIAASALGYIVPSSANTDMSIAGAAYIAVTILLYYVFKPVNKSVSLLAAMLSLTGIAIGPMTDALSIPHGFSIAMIFFGSYCLMIGYLTFKSTYLPRILGVLLAIGGLGYVINSFANLFAPAFASHGFPYLLLPGFTAETGLCLWLLVVGVNFAKWGEKERAAIGGA
ncbi:MAG TPA: DUF4386 domain-containing protein [Xanthomonadaceae bacterium]|jgi:hypothetical protein|nr:DUF4386 domain-containing protein [Xanthomonadaceae bacterium]